MENTRYKFRAWDKKRNKMYSHQDIDAINYATGKLRIRWDIDIENGQNSGNHEGNFDRFDVEQFTGLFDKNGKEIYEGDKVKLWFSEDEFTISEVRFIDGGFIVEADFGDYDLTTIGWAIEQCMDGVEVIGNIHENPELLNLPDKEKGETK